jgi:hypothetical protein
MAEALKTISLRLNPRKVKRKKTSAAKLKKARGRERAGSTRYIVQGVKTKGGFLYLQKDGNWALKPREALHVASIAEAYHFMRQHAKDAPAAVYAVQVVPA